MTRPRAWLAQARSDLAVAHRLHRLGRDGERCQVAAKCQQAVEKSVKAVIDKLGAAGVIGVRIDGRHPVARYVPVMAQLSNASATRALSARVARAFAGHRYRAVRELDELVPRFPAPGAAADRNHEYPFQDAAGEWVPPTNAGVFGRGEVKRWMAAAEVIVRTMGDLLDSLDRVYP